MEPQHSNRVTRFLLRHRQRWLVKTLVWVFLAAPLVLSWLAFAGHTLKKNAADGFDPVTFEAEISSDVVGAGGFAELFVDAWLNGRDVSQFYTETQTPPSTLIPMVDVVEVKAVSTKILSVDYVNVVVAAYVSEKLTGGNTTRVEYFSVGISTNDQYLAATGMPSQTTKPSQQTPVKTFANEFKPAGSATVAPFAETLRSFFAAYLTGSTPIEPYLAPGTVIQPIGAVYDKTVIGAVAFNKYGNDVIARVEVQTFRNETSVTQHFHLKLSERDRRWEVAEIFDAAPLKGTKQ